MDQLPNELIAKILAFCPVPVLKNLACCNTYYHNHSQPLLWRCVRIPLNKYCRERHDPQLHNLCFTRKLMLVLDVRCKEFFDCIDVVKKILPFCNQTNLEMLYFEHVLEESIAYTLSYFTNVEILHFKKCHFRNFESFRKLPDFKQLRFSTYFDIGSHENDINCRDIGFESNSGKLNELETLRALNLGVLKTLYVEEGKWASLAVLKILKAMSNLKMLRICAGRMDFHLQPESILDQGNFSLLTNLSYLDFSFCHLADDSLNRICQNLTQLKVLKFFHSKFNDSGLEDISLLRSLSTLEIHTVQDHNISTKCFLHMSPSMVLQELTFSSTLCQWEHQLAFVHHLNSIVRLRKLVVYSPAEVIWKIGSELSSSWKLIDCARPSVLFGYEVGSVFVYTFKR